MKIAVVGTGMIAREALTALQEVEDVEVVTICARPHSREKARALAQEFGVPQVWADYGAMLAAHEADFVYLGIVNSVHFDACGGGGADRARTRGALLPVRGGNAAFSSELHGDIGNAAAARTHPPRAGELLAVFEPL